jgi:hypothetical protein
MVEWILFDDWNQNHFYGKLRGIVTRGMQATKHHVSIPKGSDSKSNTHWNPIIRESLRLMLVPDLTTLQL